MSVTILPYITDMNQTDTISKTNSVPSKNREKNRDAIISSPHFDEILTAAMKATAAVAIDTLVKASDTGAVNTSMVQQFFNQHGINISVVNPNTSSNSDTSSITFKTQSIEEDNPDSVDMEELDGYFEEASQLYGVDIKLLKAIARCESNFNPNAVSRAGAVGVMQLMPGTAKGLGVANSYNAHENILGGAKLISQLLEKYDGDTSLALAAYNAGSGNVAKYGGIPPFTETQNYVTKVLNYYNS